MVRCAGMWRGRIDVARCDPDVETLAIFQGPDVYITPSWYATKQETGKVVPTWNYAVAHAYGTLRSDRRCGVDSGADGGVDRPERSGLCAALGRRRCADDYIEKLIGAVVGIEIVITRLIGKWKVSQNQPAQNQRGVVDGLHGRGDAEAVTMAGMVAARHDDNRDSTGVTEKVMEKQPENAGESTDRPYFVVIKVGGNELDDPAFLEGLALAVAAVQQEGYAPVIVHGGGKAIAALQERLGLKPTFIEGLRVTDEASLDVAEMVLSGLTNKRIVRALVNAGIRAAGFSGVDDGTIYVEKMWHPLGDLGRVGEIQDVDPHLIETLVAGGIVPVISPISFGALDALELQRQRRPRGDRDRRQAGRRSS